MNRKAKLNKLLKAMSPDETSEGFKAFDDEWAKLKSNLKEKIAAETIGDVNDQLEKFRKGMNVDGILSAISQIKEEFIRNNGRLSTEVSRSFQEMSDLFESIKKDTEELKVCSAEHCKSIDDIRSREKDFKIEIQEINKAISALNDGVRGSSELSVGLAKENRTRDKSIVEVSDRLDKLRVDFLNRISSTQGGGSPNQKVSVNSVVMSTKYADINLLAGAGITLSKADNNTTKQVEITITSSIGGAPETPSGVVDGANTVFTFLVAPNVIVVDQGRTLILNNGFTLAGLVATMDVAPVFSIFSI